MNSNFTFQLTHDQVDNIVQTVLINDARSIASSINALVNRDNLADYEKIDLEDHRLHYEILKGTLSYYLLRETLTEIIHELDKLAYGDT
jgi:hypothetical protein